MSPSTAGRMSRARRVAAHNMMAARCQLSQPVAVAEYSMAPDFKQLVPGQAMELEGIHRRSPSLSWL